MKTLLSVFGFATAVLLSDSANAGYIVDTGPGPANESVSPNTNWSLYEKQWLAERFVVPESTTITSVAGWINSDNQTAQTAHVLIYQDLGESGPGGALFSQQFSVDPQSIGFAGAKDLSWSIAAGSYFVAFEVLPGDTLMGSMPTSSENPLHLGSYGYYAMEPFEPRWYHSIDTQLGLQISAVPEPSILALSVLGALALAFSLRRNRSSQMS